MPAIERKSIVQGCGLIIVAALLILCLMRDTGEYQMRNSDVRDYVELADDGTKLYTSRRYLTDLRSLLPDPNRDFAEVTVRAKPSEKETEVRFSAAALASLQDTFQDDFEYQRHNVWAALTYQIDVANVAGDVPHVGASSFEVEVVRVRVSRNAGRELSGALLTSASWYAIQQFLLEYEMQQQARAQ